MSIDANSIAREHGPDRLRKVFDAGEVAKTSDETSAEALATLTPARVAQQRPA